MVTLVLNILNVGPYLNSYGLNYTSLLIFCLVWGMAGAFISLALSRKMAKWMMGVKLISENTLHPEERKLFDMVRKLAHKDHLPMPEVGIYQSKEINAFATGPSRKRSLVAVSSGLLQKMAPHELEAILAHEVTHIANGDMVTMTFLQGIVNAFVMFLARVLAYALSGLGKRDNRGGSQGSVMSYYLFTYLFEVVFMILGSLIIAAFSRYREFRADRGGARLSSRESMISALQTLKATQEVHDPKAESPAIAALKISHPGKKGLLSLFATHPPLEVRIERLYRS